LSQVFDIMEYIVSLDNVSVSYLHNKRDIHSIKDFVLKAEFMNPFIKKRVLNNIDLKVKKGEAVGILGRNGSGKSTLLRTIAGIIKPDEGTVEVNAPVSPLLSLGAGIELELTGIENIMIILAIAGRYRKSSIKETISQISDFAGLTMEQLKSPAKSYSTGMLTRLAFSAVTSFQPEILMIDEVLAVGDVGFQEKCYARIHEIIRLGATILFVSHSTADMMQLCTRGICLENGNLICDSTVEDASKTYLDLFHASI
jgi:ABC-type polysaccharide/polyol phosphate transport system ATPase subunit